MNVSSVLPMLLLLVAVLSCSFDAAAADAEDKSLIALQTGEKCPIISCGRNEVLKTCGLCYHNTCQNNAVQVCRKVCYCGCYCKTGYVRVTETGACILPKQCPRLDMSA